MEKDLQRRLGGLFARLEDNRALQAVRRGMLLGMPVLIIGSLALVALSLPLFSEILSLAQRIFSI